MKTKKHIYALLSILLILSQVLFSQGVEQSWVRYFNGLHQGNDFCGDIAKDNAGNIYIAGTTIDVFSQKSLIHTLKYDEYGNLLWTAVYGDASETVDFNYALGVAVDPSGNIYVAGRSLGGILVIKYNSAGNKIWDRVYLNPQYELLEPVSFKVSAGGDVFIAGIGVFTEDLDEGWVTLKYSQSGNLEWVREYDGMRDFLDFPNSIAIDAQNNSYVTGESYNYETNSGDYTTIKYSPTGTELWKRYYNGTGNDWDNAYCITVDNAGSPYITGVSFGAATQEDIVTIKYNTNGTLQWIDRFDTLGLKDAGNIVMINGIGEIIVSGIILGDFYVPSDWCLIKYSPAGTREWITTYSGQSGGEDIIKSMVFDAGNNIYITGKSLFNGYGDDILTAKYNNKGSLLWIVRFGGTGGEIPAGIVYDNSNNSVYISGSSIREGTNSDFYTVRYKQDSENADEKITSRFGVPKNYPNPFNPSTIIKFSLPEKSFVSLKVFDILGREITVLVNEILEPGAHEVNFNAGNLPGGVYFYRIEAGRFSASKKMILVK